MIDIFIVNYSNLFFNTSILLIKLQHINSCCIKYTEVKIMKSHLNKLFLLNFIE